MLVVNKASRCRRQHTCSCGLLKLPAMLLSSRDPSLDPSTTTTTTAAGGVGREGRSQTVVSQTFGLTWLQNTGALWGVTVVWSELCQEDICEVELKCRLYTMSGRSYFVRDGFGTSFHQWGWKLYILLPCFVKKSNENEKAFAFNCRES